MEKFTRENLAGYLMAVQKAAGIQNAAVDPASMTEKEWADFCMREGASKLARELMRRYGLQATEE